HQRSEDVEAADLVAGDVVQHVLPARVVLGNGLGVIAHGSGEFALRTTELLEQQVGGGGVGGGDADGVLQSLVVGEHRVLLGRAIGGLCCATARCVGAR